MRNSLLAILIAFGTSVAMPANACCVQQKDAGKGVTTGIAGTTQAAPSNQYRKMNAGEGVTTGSAISHDGMPQWYLRSEAPTLPPGTGPG
jgi:hypothetical protein